jgi:recombination protein RecA
MERKTVVKRAEPKSKSMYFASPQKAGVGTFSSGCQLLDCVLGGGWAVGRMVNLVGDKSSGKTLLAIEATANFALKFPNGRIRYAEVESAFDKSYAAALGMPVERIEFPEDKGTSIFTIEDLFQDLDKTIEENLKNPRETLYIVDSYDALSDKAEVSREIDAASYGGSKAKQGSQLFRRLVQKLDDTKITLFIISQIRDNIGVTFGAKYSRSGGHALDFYASQIVWLAEVGKMKKTISKVERPYGVEVKAKCTKNKIGLPFRECVFPIIFGYGVDDVYAALSWLNDIDRLSEVGMTSQWKRQLTLLRDSGDKMKFLKKRTEIAEVTAREWSAIEEKFLPTMTKY